MPKVRNYLPSCDLSVSPSPVSELSACPGRRCSDRSCQLLFLDPQTEADYINHDYE